MAKTQKSYASPALLKKQVADPSDDYMKYGYLGRTSQYATPMFLQGIFRFNGKGLENPFPLSEFLVYEVPTRKRAQLIYLRAGNTAAELINVLILRDGCVMRHFPVGGCKTIHIPLAVVEDLTPQTKIRVMLAAPEGLEGSLILDIGFLEL